MKIQAKIDRILQSGKLKAIASVSLDGMFVVKGLKVMDGKKGLFVSMPQEVFTGNDGKKQYSNLFFPMTNSAKTELQTAVLEAYRQRMNPNYRAENSQSGIEGVYPEHERFLQDYCQDQLGQSYCPEVNQRPYLSTM